MIFQFSEPALSSSFSIRRWHCPIILIFSRLPKNLIPRQGFSATIKSCGCRYSEYPQPLTEHRGNTACDGSYPRYSPPQAVYSEYSQPYFVVVALHFVVAPIPWEMEKWQDKRIGFEFLVVLFCVLPLLPELDEWFSFFGSCWFGWLKVVFGPTDVLELRRVPQASRFCIMGVTFKAMASCGRY